ncbi:NAD(P)-dependent oxidoreductase [Methylicorpusculum oleiharenae]|uniref:NAD(P)-dependent oxidoreductase n=1 Tax=Methylicorpusculum oleiharenae TaxID=1338687 RepID=UPI00135C4E95|nr:NAD(P)-dependent oxidoreductase [Methylicorpusculum oleiharenae]MCD2449583.1 NAD(P)-dependent oxidoreductase [Methylicorpusculum oleiharenae]
MKAGLIGLGAMGLGMARNLAKAGLLAAVYNRTESKAHDLADELRVSAHTDPAELAQVVDVVLICISADQDVLAVVNAIADSIKPGTVVIDMSTVSSDTALQAAAMMAEKQVDFLDAPVSGGVEGANNGTLVTMVGGDADALERVRPVLAAMTKRIVHMGPVGMGQATKAVNQIMCAGISQAVTEALAFGQAQGLPMDKVVDVISGGASGNWFLEHRGLTMTQGTFAPGFKLALHHKDLNICRHMAQKSGSAIPLSDKTVKDYEQLMAQGFGDEDISALYRLKRDKK